jgi:two-component system cell cycle response regulator DivK
MARILYIEDTEDNRILVSRRLVRMGHVVETANDATEGFAQISATPPDLILMDMGLPDVDGWAATTRLKADPKTQHIPIIALTAHAMAGDREESINAGCDDYDTKPFDFKRLQQKMEALLKNSSGNGT